MSMLPANDRGVGIDEVTVTRIDICEWLELIGRLQSLAASCQQTELEYELKGLEMELLEYL